MSNVENSERIFQKNDYHPQKFGLFFSPPSIILEYLVPSTGKKYKHKIKLTSLKKDSNLNETLKFIYKKHQNYLDAKLVRTTQIESIIFVF